MQQFPPNSSPPTLSPISPWTENFNNVVNQLQPSGPNNFERNGFFRIRRRKYNGDQHRSERRNTFVINFNGLKNGFRPRNIGNRFLSSHHASPVTGEFSPPPSYAVPSNLISGTSWTSANGFHLTSHHQLNNIDQIETPTHDGRSKRQQHMQTFEQKDDEDPNKIVEIESDDSPPYLPSSATHQRPSTVTPQPSPTAPTHDQTSGQGIHESNGSSVTHVDLHHEEEPPFHFHLRPEDDLSC